MSVFWAEAAGECGLRGRGARGAGAAGSAKLLSWDPPVNVASYSVEVDPVLDDIHTDSKGEHS